MNINIHIQIKRTCNKQTSFPFPMRGGQNDMSRVLRKTCFCHIRTTKAQISAFVVGCLDSMIPLVSISEISSLYLDSVAEQAGLSLTWSKPQKTGFLVTRLICTMGRQSGHNVSKHSTGNSRRSRSYTEQK